MEFEPLHDGEEAGLTVYMNEKYHYDLAVRRDGERKVVVFRRTVGSMKVEERLDCPEGVIELQIKALPERFEVSIRTMDSKSVEIGWGETHLLSTEVASGFTGVFMAMYAVSESEQATPAYFDWFDYEPVN